MAFAPFVIAVSGICLALYLVAVPNSGIKKLGALLATAAGDLAAIGLFLAYDAAPADFAQVFKGLAWISAGVMCAIFSATAILLDAIRKR